MKGWSMAIANRKAFLLFFIFLAGSVVPISVAAQNNRNAITGFVFDSRRSPVTQVPVELLNEVNQVLARTKTDGSGKYFFSSLSSGRFTVRVLPYGTNFVEQSQEVEIINFVRPGSNTSENAQARDFYLQVRRDLNGREVTGAVFVQEVPKDAEKAYLKGLAHFEANAADAGIAELMTAVKIFPEYYVALERLGREYIRKGNFEFARAAFLKAVSVNDRSFSGWYGLSFAAYALKMPEIAVAAAEKAATIGPGSPEALLMLGISQRMAKKYPEAEKALLQAKKLSAGTMPDVHWNLALLYGNNLNRYAEAANELEVYLKLSPEAANAAKVRMLISRFREKTVQPVKFTQ